MRVCPVCQWPFASENQLRVHMGVKHQMAQNQAGTLWYDAEKLLVKTLEFLGHKSATIHDTGLKIIIELEDGRSTFFLYAPNLPETQMQGHVLAWLMSESEDE